MKLTLIAVITLGVAIIVNVDLGRAYGEPGHVYLAAELAPNGGYTGFMKVGWTKPITTKKVKIDSMKTYNPRRIVMLEYIEVSNRLAAENAALIALRVRGWGINYGGGTEWFYVSHQIGSQDWQNFHHQFLEAIRPFRNPPLAIIAREPETLSGPLWTE